MPYKASIILNSFKIKTFKIYAVSVSPTTARKVVGKTIFLTGIKYKQFLPTDISVPRRKRLYALSPFVLLWNAYTGNPLYRHLFTVIALASDIEEDLPAEKNKVDITSDSNAS